jgi:hypothetical protein
LRVGRERRLDDIEGSEIWFVTWGPRNAQTDQRTRREFDRRRIFRGTRED